MAQPNNSFDAYDAVGAREDLRDAITNIDPYETPFYSNSKKSKASNNYHEWQTDTLRAPAANAHIEGDDTIASARTATTRLGNYTQIFKDAVAIPDSDPSTKKAGRSREMTYQLLKLGKELRMDVEFALFRNTARDAGSSTTPRYMASLGSWVATNTSADGGGSDPTGDGTDTRTDSGSTRAFSQTLFDTVMQSIWDSGGKPNTVYLTAKQMDIALNFTGMNNQRATIDAKARKVINDVAVYQTPWGTVEFHMTHNDRQRDRDVYILQKDMWEIAVKRDWAQTELAKTGDSTKMQMLGEFTLCAKNEKSSGGVFDLT